MSTLPEYELFAIRYATRDARRANHFIGGDPHDGPMPMDYYVWVIAGHGRTVVVDCGFNADVAKKRGRTFLRPPADGLAAAGVNLAQVDDVVLTHLHYDHVGNLGLFPKAHFHVQEPEVAYATGPYMRFPKLSHSFEVEDVCDVIRLNYAQRVHWHDGDAELAPGITLHLAGGHSAGLQCVRVHTRRGWVVLASDVTHFYENIESSRPFSTAFNVGDMLAGFELLYRLGGDLAHIVPGHDPLVMHRYPPLRPELAGVVARLDVPPSA